VRALILIIGAAFAVAVTSGCKTHPDQAQPTENMAAADMLDGEWGGGPPDQEVALDYYSNLITYAREYPKLRPAIRAAMADDIVTYGEYWQHRQRPNRSSLSHEEQSRPTPAPHHFASNSKRSLDEPPFPLHR
jgi:hypothetical protein